MPHVDLPWLAVGQTRPRGGPLAFGKARVDIAAGVQSNLWVHSCTARRIARESETFTFLDRLFRVDAEPTEADVGIADIG